MAILSCISLREKSKHTLCRDFKPLILIAKIVVAEGLA